MIVCFCVNMFVCVVSDVWCDVVGSVLRLSCLCVLVFWVNVCLCGLLVMYGVMLQEWG